MISMGAELLLLWQLIGPETSRTRLSGWAAAPRSWFGDAGDVDCVDERGAVEDFEPVVIADDADFDAGPADVELEPGVAVADQAAVADFALAAAGRVGVGGGELDDGQVDAGVGDVQLGRVLLADGLVGPVVVVVVAVGVDEALGGGQAARAPWSAIQSFWVRCWRSSLPMVCGCRGLAWISSVPA